MNGSAVFTKKGSDISLAVVITGCIDGKSYPIHIHQGTDCDPVMQGAHWDPPRGEGIPDISCQGTMGSAMHVRMSMDAKPWTIGMPDSSNIVGHVLVLHDPDDTMKRISCGKIMTQ